MAVFKMLAAALPFAVQGLYWESSQYSDSSCTSGSIVKTNYGENDGCREDDGKYRKDSCNSTLLTSTFYLDAACATLDTETSVHTMELSCHESDGDRWRKGSCSPSVKMIEFDYYQFSSAGCAVDTQTASHLGLALKTGCRADSDEDWASGVLQWIIRSEEVIVGAQTIRSKKYGSADCSGDPTSDHEYECSETCLEHPDGGGAWYKMKCEVGVASGAVSMGPSTYITVAVLATIPLLAVTALATQAHV